MHITRRHIAFILLCLYLAALGFLCFAKTQDLPSAEFSLWGLEPDKIVHFLMFAPYPALTFFSIDKHSYSRRMRSVMLVLIIISGGALAFGTEVIQGWLGYRAYELQDIAADFAGLMSCSIALAIHILLTDKK